MDEFYNQEISRKTNSKSSNDPAGPFLNNSVSSTPQKFPIPAVDTYPILHNLHQANNCNNCKNLVTGKCKVHGYQMPYPEIDCEQWEYRGKKS